jgi:hypothetical protein
MVAGSFSSSFAQVLHATDDKFQTVRTAVLFFGSLLSVSLAYLVAFHIEAPFREVTLKPALIGVSPSLLEIVVLVLAFSPIVALTVRLMSEAVGLLQRLLEVRLDRIYARPGAVFSLLSALDGTLEPAPFSAVSNRQVLVGEIIRAGVFVRVGSKVFASHLNQSQFASLKATCDQSANYIDNLATEVALPGSGSKLKITTELTNLLVSLILGLDGDLPRTAAKPASTRSILRAVGEFAKGIIVAALPVLAVLTLTKAGVPMTGELKSTALILATVWAAITVITVIDPSAISRIETTRDLLGLLRRSDSNKK